jgi:hypothetical protein
MIPVADSLVHQWIDMDQHALLDKAASLGLGTLCNLRAHARYWVKDGPNWKWLENWVGDMERKAGAIDATVLTPEELRNSMWRKGWLTRAYFDFTKSKTSTNGVDVLWNQHCEKLVKQKDHKLHYKDGRPVPLSMRVKTNHIDTLLIKAERIQHVMLFHVLARAYLKQCDMDLSAVPGLFNYSHPEEAEFEIEELIDDTDNTNGKPPLKRPKRGPVRLIRCKLCNNWEQQSDAADGSGAACAQAAQLAAGDDPSGAGNHGGSSR